MAAPAPITNALTIDVEDYFQVSALAPYIPRGQWDSIECRVERNVDRLLALLARHGTQATFFTLGWVAERYPQLVRNIVAQGHELASHGYGHERASDLTPQAFSQDIVRAKQVLEDIGGVPVQGYRAPSFSIGHGNLWAFDCLQQAGYRYSSSLYPIQHDHYGMPDAPRQAHVVREGLIEVPVSTWRLGQRNMPTTGGGWFRLFPYPLSRWIIGRVNADNQAPAIFYCHPWEIDNDQPRVPGIDIKTRFRHYVNLARTERRLDALLRDFHWGRMDDIFLRPTGTDARAPVAAH
jgi:polysaccharide deacetylase family protein (PEP-CTERM system associated)